MSIRCVVFELAGGGTYVPPPGRAKVAQTPGRARVKRSSLEDGAVVLVAPDEYLGDGPQSLHQQAAVPLRDGVVLLQDIVQMPAECSVRTVNTCRLAFQNGIM